MLHKEAKYYLSYVRVQLSHFSAVGERSDGVHRVLEKVCHNVTSSRVALLGFKRLISSKLR